MLWAIFASHVITKSTLYNYYFKAGMLEVGETGLFALRAVLAGQEVHADHGRFDACHGRVWNQREETLLLYLSLTSRTASSAAHRKGHDPVCAEHVQQGG